MKIVIAPSPFKEWKTSPEVAQIQKEGILEASSEIGVTLPEIDIVPVNDGGEGTIDAIRAAKGGRYITVDNIVNPVGDTIQSQYLSLPVARGEQKTAFVEMARSSGLGLIEAGRRDPLCTTSYGVGQLIFDAYRKGHKRILVGVGGAGSHDGGVGMAQALGVNFFVQDRSLVSFMCNAQIDNISGWSLGRLVDEISHYALIQVVSDVSNPLLGPQGASYVFFKQKGGTEEGIPIAEKNLAKLADIAESELLRRDARVYQDRLKAHFGADAGSKNYRDIQGSGAAGGLPYGILIFLGGYVRKGITLVTELVDLEGHIKNADVVFTGEGRLDSTTFRNKTVMGVGEIARKVAREQNRKIPVVAVAGCVGEYDSRDSVDYLDHIHAASPATIGMDEVRQNGRKYLKEATKKAFLELFPLTRAK